MFSFRPVASETSTTASPSTTVRPGAKAVVTSSSGTLLVKEQHDDGSAFWTLPGGGVEPEESPARGLRRELREELRCDSVVGDTVSAFWYAHSSSVDTVSRYVVFACGLLSQVRPVRREGILDAAWMKPAELPPTVLPQVRRLVQRHHGKTDTRDREIPGASK